MKAIWDKLKSLWPTFLWFLAGVILLINPSHIDQIAGSHPKWSGVILALWTALLAWAQKLRPQSPPPSSGVYPPGTGQNPVSPTQNRNQAQAQPPPSQKPYTGGLR